MGTAGDKVGLGYPMVDGLRIYFESCCMVNICQKCCGLIKEVNMTCHITIGCTLYLKTEMYRYHEIWMGKQTNLKYFSCFLLCFLHNMTGTTRENFIQIIMNDC